MQPHHAALCSMFCLRFRDMFTWKFLLSNIKHQGRLKVLQKLYYLRRDISVALVEAVFKLMKVQSKTDGATEPNTQKNATAILTGYTPKPSP